MSQTFQPRTLLGGHDGKSERSLWFTVEDRKERTTRRRGEEEKGQQKEKGGEKGEGKRTEEGKQEGGSGKEERKKKKERRERIKQYQNEFQFRIIKIHRYRDIRYLKKKLVINIFRPHCTNNFLNIQQTTT